MMWESVVRFGKFLNRGVAAVVLAVTYIVLIGAYALPMRAFMRARKAAWQAPTDLGDFRSPY